MPRGHKRPPAHVLTDTNHPHRVIPAKAGISVSRMHRQTGTAVGAPLHVDNLSLSKMHGSHVDLSIADQTVKIYIGFVAGEAAPYPPPSDPLLATPDLGRILLPRPLSTRFGASPPPLRWTITFDLASALSSGSNFGWSLFFSALCFAPRFAPFCFAKSLCPLPRPCKPLMPANLHGSPSHCAFVSQRAESDSRRDQNSGVRGAAPPRSDASADDPCPAHPLGRGPLPSWSVLSPPRQDLPHRLGRRQARR